MGDLNERLQADVAYDRWNLGESEQSNAADALVRIDELEAELEAKTTAHARSLALRANAQIRIDELETALREIDGHLAKAQLWTGSGGAPSTSKTLRTSAER